MYTEQQISNLNHNAQGSAYSDFKFENGKLNALFSGQVMNGNTCYNGVHRWNVSAWDKDLVNFKYKAKGDFSGYFRSQIEITSNHPL